MFESQYNEEMEVEVKRLEAQMRASYMAALGAGRGKLRYG